MSSAEPLVASEHFAERLVLNQIDRDIFTGLCHAGAPLRAYGGQIAAQSLMAAGATVNEASRSVHSLHGYFLRPGQTKDSITYLVDRVRDGRSFSTRYVRAVQHGETIFMMTASFADLDPGPMHQFMMPPAPDPDQVSDVIFEHHQHGHGHGNDLSGDQIFQLRTVGHDRPTALVDGRYEQVSWVRIPESLPDNWLIQASALTYLSDLTMVSTALGPHGGKHAAQNLMLASIDHAVWFHAPIQTQNWLLFAQDTPVARGGHGLARGLFFDQSGTLIASVVQESLMRNRRSP